jgi:hypothetical protein
MRVYPKNTEMGEKRINKKKEKAHPFESPLNGD